MAAKKKIALLTGGGDCQGLNAVITAVVKKAASFGYKTIGIKDGWKGLVNGDTMPLDEKAVEGIVNRGGTIIGTSRHNPYKTEGDVKKAIANIKKMKIHALVAMGGEDTLGVANKLYKEGVPIVGVPKTIDNDLSATDYTFGFDTAINIVAENIDRLHTTAESHHRVIVCEVMGRHAGWIALYGGLAGGADIVLIPEVLIDIDKVCRILKDKRKKGKGFAIVVVAEGAKLKKGKAVLKHKRLDAFGHVYLGGIGEELAGKIKEITKFETRHTVLGHIQRGGTPSAMDRVLSLRYGVKAAELIRQRKFGYMVTLRGNKILAVKLERAVKKIKTVDKEFYDITKMFYT